ncbi:unnamed protein product [Hymenolepis diminuta]|uniref:Uncharacterized protein n=1 Tax=Hymenolepis diminuta TaxID=6216 RepID=A0A564YJ82_HYMDI|nr:unnamed protein product [Hymenolepis diminuta]
MELLLDIRYTTICSAPHKIQPTTRTLLNHFSELTDCKNELCTHFVFEHSRVQVLDLGQR